MASFSSIAFCGLQDTSVVSKKAAEKIIGFILGLIFQALVWVKTTRDLNETSLPNSAPRCLQQLPAFLAHKCNGHKRFCWRPYIIHHPFRIMVREHFTDAICPVTHGVGAFIPVKQLHPVVQLLLLVVDSYLNGYLLFARKRGNRNDDMTHSAYIIQLLPQEDCHI